MADLTLATLVKYVKRNLRIMGYDNSVISGHTGDAEIATKPDAISITDELNIAMDQLSVELGFVKDESTVATVIGQRNYALPGGIFFPESVYIGDNRLRLSTPQDQDDTAHDWRGKTGTPRIYYLVGAKKIGLVPLPNAVVSVGVFGPVTPTHLAGSTDVPTGLVDVLQHLLHIRAAANIAATDTSNERMAGRVAAMLEREKTIKASYRKSVLAGSLDDDQPIGIKPGQTSDPTPPAEAGGSDQ